jgi:hypothetical protein
MPIAVSDPNAEASLSPKISNLSQKVWNDAYDYIETHEEELVKSYALALKAFSRMRTRRRPCFEFLVIC